LFAVFAFLAPLSQELEPPALPGRFRLYWVQSRHDEAEPLLKRALAGSEKVLGTEHPNTLTIVNNLD
jgi:hypothetical protein